MKSRRLGSAGPEISVVGFGAWAAGGEWKWGWAGVDDDESVAAIRRAIELGVNWVDTAALYGLGRSERVVGRAIAPFRAGEEVFVFTKCGRSWHRTSGDEIDYDLRPESIRFECEQSLERLGLERIDLYQFHWPDTQTGTPVEESWATMAALVDEGKVRWIGVSNFDVALLERCEQIRHVDSLQPPLNLLDRTARADVIPWCREHGTGVIVYSPLASGLLSGALDRESIAALPEDDWRRSSPSFQDPELGPTLALLGRLRELAGEVETTVAALAVAWTLHVSGVTGAICGARSARRVESWPEAAALQLSPDVLGAIDEAIRRAQAAHAGPRWR